MNKKYQVFISSTFSDLVQERQDTIRSVLDLGHIPSGMEIFPAADMEQFEYIKKVVDECDYYVLVIGARYGSTDAAGVSFTEKEYNYAVEKQKTVLAFIHGDPSSIPVAKADIDPGLSAKLTTFRTKVQSGRLVQFWTSQTDLKSKVIIALTKAFGESPGVGWVRADAAASEDLLAQINVLRNYNDQLKVENERLSLLNQPNVDGLVGLDEVFEVRSHFRYWDTRSSVWKDSTDGVSAKLTWAEIFSAVGPALMRPVHPDAISTAVVKYLRENKGIRQESMTLFDTDANTIKLHFIAVGLIASEAAESKGGGVMEFVSITPRGRKQLLELLAVRQTGAIPLSP